VFKDTFNNQQYRPLPTKYLWIFVASYIWYQKC
jgi:hypothetical protein